MMDMPSPMDSKTNEAPMELQDSTKTENTETKKMDMLHPNKDGEIKMRKTINSSSAKPRKGKGLNSKQKQKPIRSPDFKMVLRSDKPGPGKDGEKEVKKSDVQDPSNSRRKKVNQIDATAANKDGKKKAKKAVDEGSSKSKKKKGLETDQKNKPARPPISKMVLASIKSLKDSNGSSLQAIRKYISEHYKVDMEQIKPDLNNFLKKSIEKGNLEKGSGKGLLGKFKIKN